jgi:hypothetical protein
VDFLTKSLQLGHIGPGELHELDVERRLPESVSVHHRSKWTLLLVSCPSRELDRPDHIDFSMS